MTIDRIVLTNVGVFAGRNEIVLTPTDPRKPVVLIGGQNGGGKTTLLDALQLAFYGPLAKCAGRGKLAYKAYLKDLVHSGVDPAEGAAVQVHFRRITEGQPRALAVTRSWSDRGKGVEEFVDVVSESMRDPVLSEHWAEYIENYLPASLASLFFFDGEQIAAMAEDEHAAGLLETALQSLLGLDLVEQLKIDLSVLERRKTEMVAKDEVRLGLETLEAEVKGAEQAVEAAVQEQARIKSLLAHLRDKDLVDLRTKFSKDGGDLFLQREELARQRASVQGDLAETEQNLKALAAGVGPLLLVEDLLCAVEEQANRELEQQRNRLLAAAEEERDRQVIEFLRKRKLAATALAAVRSALDTHRHTCEESATTAYLNPPPELPEELRRLREVTLPQTEARVAVLLSQYSVAREHIARLDGQLASVPSADAIGHLQQQIQKLEKRIQEAEVELRVADETRRLRDVALAQKQRAWRALFDKATEASESAEDDGRILSRIPRIQSTLGELRQRVVARHLSTFERVILESFQCLLHKTNLVTALRIAPVDYRITLTGSKGQALPFQRLSAGERQLLAASILWGIAKASGRPVPTFIDTPLGRLDSSHRRHLVERYFPAASHQVVLLSTDEEIIGKYHSLLGPCISRTYRLSHNKGTHRTTIEEGYFS